LIPKASVLISLYAMEGSEKHPSDTVGRVLFPPFGGTSGTPGKLR
jgi:hypothetical protein